MSILPIERYCTCCISVDDSDNNHRTAPEPAELLWCIICDDQNGLSSSPVEYTTTSSSTFGMNHRTDDDDDVVTAQELLLQNFEKYGWSPIRIRWKTSERELSSPSLIVSQFKSMSASAYDLLQQYLVWEDIHRKLFHHNDDDNKNWSSTNQSDEILVDGDDDHVTNGVLRFVPSESGASGSTNAEAKVSWEYQRRYCASSTLPKGDSSSTNEKQRAVKCRLHAWTEIFHAVICHVMEELQLPTEQLIVNYNDGKMMTSIEDISSNETRASLQPLDLLRAFRYDPVSTFEDTTSDNNDDKAPEQIVLGSSPHTDWGSWTVVWQDDTTYPPCLQTYCYHCQKWNPVIPSPPLKDTSCDDIDTGNVANFIVHVGDITSLCIRHTIQRGQNISESLLSSPSNSNYAVPDIANMWPSPRHRVVSPLQQRKYRHSLVYFVYPPPLETTTPARIIESLQEWCHTHYANIREWDDERIPYGDYSLLSDQSASINIETDTNAIASTASVGTFMENDQCTRQVIISTVSATQDHEKHRQRWSTMQHTSIRNIIEEKWKQVQR